MLKKRSRVVGSGQFLAAIICASGETLKDTFSDRRAALEWLKKWRQHSPGATVQRLELYNRRRMLVWSDTVLFRDTRVANGK